MARTKCSAKKVAGTNLRRVGQKALVNFARMTTKRSAAGHARRRRDPLEAESPLTTPPSSPDPSESFPMDAILMGSEEAAAQHCRVSYTHNRVSMHFLTTYFVDVFPP